MGKIPFEQVLNIHTSLSPHSHP